MSVTFREFAVPLSRPLSTAAGDLTERRGFLVSVAVGEIRGVGEATPLPGWTEPRADCRAALAAVGDDPTAVADLDPGVVPAARHGLSLAVADARARAAGVPLAGSLADDPAAAVPVNATVGDADPTATAASAREAVDGGYGTLKVKVGARSLEADLDRLDAVREAVGKGPTLRADANGAWDRETATAAVDALAARDVAYVEQPLPAGDLEGHAAIRGRGVGVALDESVAADADAVLAADAADVVVLKPMALGGVDRAFEVAERARAAGVRAVVTTTVDAAVARAGAVHLAAALPSPPACGLATGELLADDVASDPAPVRDGVVAVPAGPGLAGAAFDDLR
jgi:o-succinylbenzoate synthase